MQTLVSIKRSHSPTAVLTFIDHHGKEQSLRFSSAWSDAHVLKAFNISDNRKTKETENDKVRKV